MVYMIVLSGKKVSLTASFIAIHISGALADLRAISGTEEVRGLLNQCALSEIIVSGVLALPHPSHRRKTGVIRGQLG